jgi:mono/diheme cytochrome c family protein
MKKFKFLAAVLPLIAAAACADSNAGVTDPDQVILRPSRGEILADRLCSQCHGKTFMGNSGGTNTCPALDLAASVSFEHFDAMMTAETEEEGSAMVAVENSYRMLPAADRKALHEFLSSLFQLP